MTSPTVAKQPMTPIGGYVLSRDPIEVYPGRPTTTLKVRNTGDRPIQVGSHFHFFEVNRALEFDRPKAFGMHLALLAGTAVRFEPGDEKEITLVPYGGKKRVRGFNDLTNGSVASRRVETLALERSKEFGFKSAAQPEKAGRR